MSRWDTTVSPGGAMIIVKELPMTKPNDARAFDLEDQTLTKCGNGPVTQM